MRVLRSSIVVLGLLATLGCHQTPPHPGSIAKESATVNDPSHVRPPRARPTTAPGFDFYLLNLSWSPEYCATHPSATECASHSGLVLHGLWPQNTNGTYPQHCSGSPGPQNPGQYADLYPDPSLLEHEWNTHGTCSGLAPDAYFTMARTAFRMVQTPPVLGPGTKTISEPPSQLLDQFSAVNRSIPLQSFAISCGNNTLTAVEVCLDKDLRAIACSNVRGCGARTITVTPRD